MGLHAICPHLHWATQERSQIEGKNEELKAKASTNLLFQQIHNSKSADATVECLVGQMDDFAKESQQQMDDPVQLCSVVNVGKCFWKSMMSSPGKMMLAWCPKRVMWHQTVSPFERPNQFQRSWSMCDVFGQKHINVICEFVICWSCQTSMNETLCCERSFLGSLCIFSNSWTWLRMNSSDVIWSWPFLLPHADAFNGQSLCFVLPWSHFCFKNVAGEQKQRKSQGNWHLAFLSTKEQMTIVKAQCQNCSNDHH